MAALDPLPPLDPISLATDQRRVAWSDLVMMSLVVIGLSVLGLVAWVAATERLAR